MRELPILYSTPMVQAILENKKKMTRRIAGLEKVNEHPDNWKIVVGDWTTSGILFFNRNGYSDRMKPRYQVGDKIYVKETYRITNPYGNPNYKYKADFDSNITGVKFKWKPSLFMPKAAARIWLEVTNVRCERLHDITEADAIAEGIFSKIDEIYKYPIYRIYYKMENNWWSSNPIESFQSLWEMINGDDCWILNPWVFVYEFKRIEKP